MSDILGVSISGLKVSQNALRTAGHNIANADTEGYSRQNTEINSLGGTPSGVGYLGNGAFTARVERVVNEFVTGQVRQDTTLYNQLNAYNEHIVQLNDVLSNQSTGLTQGLNSFFAAMQNAVDDPASLPARQLLISESDNLADRFNTLYTRVTSINNSVEQNFISAVENINTLTNNIASLNKSISEAQGASNSITPNDLLDQRDEALRQLSQFVSVQSFEQGDMVNVTIGNGIPVVVGQITTSLAISQNEFDPLQTEIVLPTLSQPITDSLTGGEIGGLVEIQQDILLPTLNEMGRVALVIADSMNTLQQQGITPNNAFGNNLFFNINDSDIVDDRVLSSDNNTTTDQLIDLTITDSSQLTTSDYQFIIDNTGTSYRVVRLADETEVAIGAVPGVLPASISFDGLSLNLQLGTYSAEDEFLIRPTRSGASDFSAIALQPEDIALASPVLTGTGIGNEGTGQISLGEVLSINDAAGAALPLLATAGQMSPPLLVRFTTPSSYDIMDNSDPGNPTQLSPPIRNQVYVPGIQNSLFAMDMGETTVVSSGTALGLPVGSVAVGAGLAANAYPSESFTFTLTDPITGATTPQTVVSTLNASARTTAGLFDNVDGVSATAFNYMELRDFTVSLASPLQINLNGENLVPYDGAAIRADVPSPASNSGEDFNDFLANEINNNANLQTLGIYAVSAYDATAGEFYIQVHSVRGDDLTVQLEALAGEVVEVNDGTNADVAITGAGAGTVNEVLVGGRIDINLADNIALTTAPSPSTIMGAISASSNYLGIQANVIGTLQAGDNFTIDFNRDAASDNRNGLLMVGLQQAETIGNGQQSFTDAYSGMVESIGIQTNASNINTEAADNVLDQTVNLRNSISAVNLDEEAADLIRFEQLYSANAQVINVARELFDRLISSL